MKAVDFPQRNVMLAEDQPEYETLPVHLETKEIIVPNGPHNPMTKQIPWQMTACFELSDEEIAQIVANRKIWYKQCLFGHNFQPMVISTENPFE